MSLAVVEVGPGGVRGPRPVRLEPAATALECVDDPLALRGDRAVPVAELWQEVLRETVGETDRLALVVPGWWACGRVATIKAAATAVASEVTVLRRDAVLRHRRRSTVVEIADEVVVVHPVGRSPVALPRVGSDEQLARAVVEAVGTGSEVLLDRGPGAGGDATLVRAILARVRAAGDAAIPVSATTVRVAAARLADAEREPAGVVPRVSGRPRRCRRAAALTGSLLVAALLAGALLARPAGVPAPPAASAATVLIEGRVGLTVPANWDARRVTTGPGSARLQVDSPAEPRTALLITQSPLPGHQSLLDVAETLRKALDLQPAGVFVGFNPDDRRADRPAVTYSELRDDRRIDWAVVVDGALRIGIGCQSPTERSGAVRLACDQAIRTAHAVF